MIKKVISDRPAIFGLFIMHQDKIKKDTTRYKFGVY